MPETTLPAEFFTLLANADRPVYAIDGDRAVVFANTATAAWLGLEADAVIGRRVAYHSVAGEATGALLTGLCPKPEALAGAEATGTISCVARTGGLRRRRARYVPLGGGAVLVIGETRDLTPDELTELVSGGSPDELHQAIHQFHAGRAAAAQHLTPLLGQSPATRKLREQFDAAVKAGCNTLVVGALPGERRELAEALHHATTQRAPQRGQSAMLLPIDTTRLVVEEIRELVSAAARRNDRLTLTLLQVDELLEEQQQGLARLMRELRPARVLATAGDATRVDGELDALIATITLQLSPLADRRDDLPLLLQWAVEQQNAASSKQISGLSEPAFELLLTYPYRDLAQLQEIVAEAHHACRGPMIERGDLPAVAGMASLAAELAPTRESVDLDTLLADVEREVVTRALATARGNKAEAARLVGLTRPRFYRVIERLGLHETTPQQGSAATEPEDEP